MNINNHSLRFSFFAAALSVACLSQAGVALGSSGALFAAKNVTAPAPKLDIVAATGATYISPWTLDPKYMYFTSVALELRNDGNATAYNVTVDYASLSGDVSFSWPVGVGALGPHQSVWIYPSVWAFQEVSSVQVRGYYWTNSGSRQDFADGAVSLNKIVWVE